MTILTPFIILGALGILFALLLGFASKKFEVQVDRRVLKVREMLPVVPVDFQVAMDLQMPS